MTTIELNPRHGKKKKQRFVSIATSWDELKAEQLVAIMKILFLKGYKAEQMLLRLLQVLTRLSDAEFFRCDVEDLDEYFYLTAFLLRPDFSFTKNLLPVYAHPDGKEQRGFYGPDDAIANLRMKEFAFAEGYFIKWADSEKKDSEALHHLIGVLYRPMAEGYDYERNPAGDYREAFNNNYSAYYAKHFIPYWPPSIKLSIATWYDGCRRNLVGQFDEVFSGNGEPSRYGLLSVMLDVAKEKALGDFDKVELEYVQTVLMFLTETILQAKKLQKSS